MILAILLAAAPQIVPPNFDLADAKCMLAVASLVDARKASTEDSDSVRSTMMFFAGKIAGRSGAQAVKVASESAYKDMQMWSADQLQAAADRCYKEMAEAFPK